MAATIIKTQCRFCGKELELDFPDIKQQDTKNALFKAARAVVCSACYDFKNRNEKAFWAWVRNRKALTPAG